MSQERKSVKILSFVAFGLFVARLVLVIVGIVQGGMPGASADVGAMVWSLGAAIICLASSVFGIRGANRPSAINPLRIFTLIGFVLGIVKVVLVFTLGPGPNSQMVGIVDGVATSLFFGIYYYLTTKVIAQRDKI